VRACRDGGLRPPSWYAVSRHEGGGCASALCATRSPDRGPVKGCGSSEIVKGVEYSPQVGNNLWRTPVKLGGLPLVPGRTCSVRAARGGANASSGVVPVHRWKAPRVQRTSGFFAEAREKRPWPRMCPRKRHVSRGGVPCPSQGGSPEGPAGGLAQAGRRGSVSSYPSRGWGSRGGIVSGTAPSPEPGRSRRTLQPAWPRSHDERCPSGSGRGNRWSNAGLSCARPAPGP